MKDNMPDEPWYCLMIIDRTGSHHSIYGSKDTLWPFYKRWSEKDFIDGQHLSVDGTCDSCDRAPLHVSFDPDFIGAVHLSLYS